MKRAMCFLINVCLSVCMLFACAGCDLFSSSSDGESEAMKMYHEAVADGYTGSYLDFLDDYAAWTEGDGNPDGSDGTGDDPSDGESGSEDISNDPAGSGNGNLSEGNAGEGAGQPSASGVASVAALSVVSIQSSFRTRYGVQQVSSGAGVLYTLDRATGDAYIVTNYHVVYSSTSVGTETVAHVSDNITVWLYGGEDDGGAIAATFVGGAIDYDVAVLSVKGEQTVSVKSGTHTNKSVFDASAARAIERGDSESVAVGDPVYAIGNANGDGISVSAGVLSVAAEYIEGESVTGRGTATYLVMRIDAAVNHGNSGGGLFDAQGKFIGTVNARSEESGVVGVGYAIPAALVYALADNAIAAGTGGVLRADLGFTPVVSYSHSVYDQTTGKTKFVEPVAASNVGGPAAGRLQSGDVLLSYTRNGKTCAIERGYLLTFLRFSVRSGDAVEYEVLRDGHTVSVTVNYTDADFTEIS